MAKVELDIDVNDFREQFQWLLNWCEYQGYDTRDTPPDALEGLLNLMGGIRDALEEQGIIVFPQTYEAYIAIKNIDVEETQAGRALKAIQKGLDDAGVVFDDSAARDIVDIVDALYNNCDIPTRKDFAEYCRDYNSYVLDQCAKVVLMMKEDPFPKREELRSLIIEAMPVGSERDSAVQKLWDELADIPFDFTEEYPDGCLSCDWAGFKAGTDKYDIWHWFDDTYSHGIYSLMFPESSKSAVEIESRKALWPVAKSLTERCNGAKEASQGLENHDVLVEQHHDTDAR